MLSVFFIGSGLSSGGAEHQCSLLMNMLTEIGYDVTYVSFGDVSDHYYVSSDVNRVQLAPGKSALRKAIALELFLLKVRADVVFAFSQRMSVFTLFPLLLRPSIKVISGERNYTLGKPDIYETILVKTGIYKRANHIIPNSYSQGRYLSSLMPALQKKIHVITNYTDTGLYQSSPVPNNNIPRVGIFCRFEAQKNFKTFIEALHLLAQNPENHFCVEWYGNHTFKTNKQQMYFEEGLRKIEEYHLDGLISIHDATKDVPILIPTFDVMCLPSLHEGFSNSISEYICCGRPVICSDVSDNKLMVHEGVNGFLFDPLNVKSIVLAFEKYLSTSKAERVTMGLNSRAIAESLFDKDRFINDYIRIIEA